MPTSNLFAKSIATAISYFISLEAIQFLNSDREQFEYGKDILLNEPPGKYDFIIGIHSETTLLSITMIN